ncbi:hypothetical protein J6590_041044 [Homalodisca vitripennis]|nr:hypothetical protein J6590_041044 [Homalodisca vitripennis]
MSDFERIRRTCVKRGELWEDPEFPATQTSVFYHQTPPFQFVWKRPKWGELQEDPEFSAIQTFVSYHQTPPSSLCGSNQRLVSVFVKKQFVCIGESSGRTWSSQQHRLLSSTTRHHLSRLCGSDPRLVSVLGTKQLVCRGRSPGGPGVPRHSDFCFLPQNTTLLVRVEATQGERHEKVVVASVCPRPGAFTPTGHGFRGCWRWTLFGET